MARQKSGCNSISRHCAGGLTRARPLKDGPVLSQALVPHSHPMTSMVNCTMDSATSSSFVLLSAEEDPCKSVVD